MLAERIHMVLRQEHTAFYVSALGSTMLTGAGRRIAEAIYRGTATATSGSGASCPQVSEWELAEQARAERHWPDSQSRLGQQNNCTTLAMTPRTTSFYLLLVLQRMPPTVLQAHFALAKTFAIQLPLDQPVLSPKHKI